MAREIKWPCLAQRSGMDGLQKPFGREIAADALFFGAVVDERADRGELDAEAEIVDEAGNLLFVFAAARAAADHRAQLRQTPPCLARFLLDRAKARGDLGDVLL